MILNFEEARSFSKSRDGLFDENVSKNSIREEEAEQNDMFSFCFLNIKVKETSEEVESHGDESISPEEMSDGGSVFRGIENSGS